MGRKGMKDGGHWGSVCNPTLRGRVILFGRAHRYVKM